MLKTNCVDASGYVTPMDALYVIHQLNDLRRTTACRCFCLKRVDAPRHL